jgi:pimeloyl-ACP methyl ester carboxylesterase
MAVTKKPTLVLVPGGWSVPASYAKLTSALKAAGYEVHVPALPSVSDERPPKADLDTDTQVVRDYVTKLADEGHTIIAILHSYSGQVGTNALKGLGLEARSQQGKPGGVVHLVYMCASASLEGVSMVDKVKEFDHMHLMPVAFDFAEDGSVVCRAPKVTMVTGEGVPEEEIDAYVDSLVRWNGKCMYQPISQCAWREIPVSYIYTTLDMTLPLDYQKSMVQTLEKEGRKVDTYELQTGHCPNLTATDGVVDVIEKVAAKVQA